MCGDLLLKFLKLYQKFRVLTERLLTHAPSCWACLKLASCLLGLEWSPLLIHGACKSSWIYWASYAFGLGSDETKADHGSSPGWLVFALDDFVIWQLYGLRNYWSFIHCQGVIISINPAVVFSYLYRVRTDKGQNSERITNLAMSSCYS